MQNEKGLYLENHIHLCKCISTNLATFPSTKWRRRERKDLFKIIEADFTCAVQLPPPGASMERHKKTIHLEGAGLSGACTLLKRWRAEESRLC